MISVEKARGMILEQVRRTAIEKVDLLSALQRVLAEAIVSKRDHPPWDNSAMDGFAVRQADALQASERSPVVLDVIEEIPAGKLPQKMVGPGQASRIMTGAPVPQGADAVIRIEDTRLEGSRVHLLTPAEAGENIRRRGEDIRAGQVVLEPGDSVGPAEVGLLASIGRTHVEVYQQPRIAILATGDELADLDEEPTPHKIINSNSYALAAQVVEAGGVPVILGIARDSRETVLDRLSRGLSADLIVVSGGVSAGEYDFVKDVLMQLGMSLVFWKVAMKPGEPMAFGMLQGRPVFGLPGNPVSTMVTFELFVRPALKKMQGHRSIFRPVVDAVLREPITKRPGKTHFLRAVVHKQAGDYEVRTTGNQSSGVLTSMVKADGLLIAPAEASQLQSGQTVKVLLLEKGLSDRDVPGY